MHLLSIEEQIRFVLTYKEKTKQKYQVFINIKNFALRNAKETELTNEFKVEFIKLMCIFEKHKVYQELASRSYPSFQIQEAIKGYNIELANAHLLERVGASSEAIKIYKRRLKKVLKSLVVGQRFKDTHKRQRLMEKVQLETEIALRVCRESDNPPQVEKTSFLPFSSIFLT